MKNFVVREEDEGSSNRDSKKPRMSFLHTTRIEELAALFKEEHQESEEEEEEDESEEGGEEEEEEEDGNERGEVEEEEEENEGGENEEEDGGTGERGGQDEEEGDEEENVEASGIPMLETDAGSLVYAAKEGSNSLTLTDPEVLDCPICYELLKIPVFQCVNGHTACSTCCTKMKNICPSCTSSIGSIRCRAIEKVLESTTVSCKNKNYGCSHSPLYTARHKHEDVCDCTPCFCPFSDCSFKGSWKQLSEHISHKHRTSTKRFKYEQSIRFTLDDDQRFLIFQEENDGCLIILNSTMERLGNVVSVSRIGPRTTGSLNYELVAKGLGTLLKLQSFTNSIQKRVEALPSTNFLVIPSQFSDPFMELCISGSEVAQKLKLKLKS